MKKLGWLCVLFMVACSTGTVHKNDLLCVMPEGLYQFKGAQWQISYNTITVEIERHKKVLTSLNNCWVLITD